MILHLFSVRQDRLAQLPNLLTEKGEGLTRKAKVRMALIPLRPSAKPQRPLR